MEIANALVEAGFEVIGPASSVGQALALIAQAGCDAAVLDVNLRGETSEAVARALTSAPFVIMSGYAREQQPPAMRDAPLIGKPFQPKALVDEIRRCLRVT